MGRQNKARVSYIFLHIGHVLLRKSLSLFESVFSSIVWRGHCKTEAVAAVCTGLAGAHSKAQLVDVFLVPQGCAAPSEWASEAGSTLVVDSWWSQCDYSLVAHGHTVLAIKTSLFPTCHSQRKLNSISQRCICGSRASRKPFSASTERLTQLTRSESNWIIFSNLDSLMSSE